MWIQLWKKYRRKAFCRRIFDFCQRIWAWRSNEWQYFADAPCVCVCVRVCLFSLWRRRFWQFAQFQYTLKIRAHPIHCRWRMFCIAAQLRDKLRQIQASNGHPFAVSLCERKRKSASRISECFCGWNFSVEIPLKKIVVKVLTISSSRLLLQ